MVAFTEGILKLTRNGDCWDVCLLYLVFGFLLWRWNAQGYF